MPHIEVAALHHQTKPDPEPLILKRSSVGNPDALLSRMKCPLPVAGLLVVLLVSSLGSTPVAAAGSAFDMRYPSDAHVSWVCRVLARGETTEVLFGNRWPDVLRFNRMDRRHAVAGVSLKVPRRLRDVRDFTPMPATYPDAAAEAKFVLIDLTEQFLGAYEQGRLAFSSPLSAGDIDHLTPVGDFTITAAHRRHSSSLYNMEGTDIPYPMTWALRFHISREGVSFWLHGRDIPGYPASHGCIGLYDEWMQQDYYGLPARPALDDARRLYEWVAGPADDNPQMRSIVGPRLRIVRGASSNRSLSSTRAASSPSATR
jgi:lipoprotein-anchoring transpeptidase ErfK/SrfK